MGGTYVNADKKVVLNDGSTEICVYYSRNEYIIRFIFGEVPGAGEDVVLKLPYESAITPPDFKVAGYEIAGWSPELPETMPAEECTYVAKWQVASADVTVNHYVESLDGTDRVITETETVSAETGASLPSAYAIEKASISLVYILPKSTLSSDSSKEPSSLRVRRITLPSSTCEMVPVALMLPRVP